MKVRNIGKQIKEAREKQNMSQAELGKKLFVSSQAVSNWENNRNGIDIETKNKMEEVLHIILQEEITEEIDTNIEPFHEIKDIDRLIEVLGLFICAVGTEDVFSKSLNHMLLLTALEVVGFVCSCSEESKNNESIKWKDIAEYIQVLFFGQGPKTIIVEDDNRFNADTHSVTAKIMKLAAQKTSEKMFSIFSDEESFVSAVNNVGANAGYYLSVILPEEDNTLLTLFRLYLTKMVDLMRQAD